MSQKTFWPADGLAWKLACFGRLEFNPAVPSEPSIELCLTREELEETPKKSGQVTAGPDALPVSSEESRNTPKVDSGKLKKPVPRIVSRTVKIGIGMLPAYELGSFYTDQKLSGASAGMPFDEIVDFDNEKMHYVVAWDRMHKLNSGSALSGQQWLIPPAKLSIPASAKNTPFLVLPIIKGAYDFLVVPGPEIARTWFMRSTVLAHAVISDTANELAKKLLVSMPDMDGRRCYKPLLPLDPAEMLVALAAWHSQSFRKQADGMFTRYAAHRISGQDNYLKPLPPVEGSARVTANGLTNIDIATGARLFIANRLILVPKPTMDLPYECLQVVYDKGLGDLPGPGAATRRRRFGPGKSRRPPEASKVGHDDEPNNKLDEDIYEPCLAGFDDMPDLTKSVIYERDPTEGAYRAPVAGAVDGQSSSGKGKSSGELSPARARGRQTDCVTTTEHNRPPALPAGFESIVKAMGIFRDKWRGRYRNLGDTVGFDGSTITSLEFPVVVDGQSVSWCYYNETRPRRYLAIEIEKSSRYAYLFDIQLREKGESQDDIEPNSKRGKKGERYTMLAVVKAAFEPMSLPEIRSLIIELGLRPKSEGRWSTTSVTGIYAEKWKHTFSEPEQLAARIFGLISNDLVAFPQTDQKNTDVKKTSLG